MRSMFYYCLKFNSDLSEWDVSNVKNITFMFTYCKNFNCDLSKWKVKPNIEVYLPFDATHEKIIHLNGILMNINNMINLTDIIIENLRLILKQKLILKLLFMIKMN